MASRQPHVGNGIPRTVFLSSTRMDDGSLAFGYPQMVRTEWPTCLRDLTCD